MFKILSFGCTKQRFKTALSAKMLWIGNQLHFFLDFKWGFRLSDILTLGDEKGTNKKVNFSFETYFFFFFFFAAKISERNIFQLNEEQTEYWTPVPNAAKTFLLRNFSFFLINGNSAFCLVLIKVYRGHIKKGKQKNWSN